jgi:hypothetical protein
VYTVFNSNNKQKGKIMKLYVYDNETMEVMAIINGASNEECETKANEAGYSGGDEIGWTYSPAFGCVDGLKEKVAGRKKTWSNDYVCTCEDEYFKNNCSGECDLCIYCHRSPCL